MRRGHRRGVDGLKAGDRGHRRADFRQSCHSESSVSAVSWSRGSRGVVAFASSRRAVSSSCGVLSWFVVVVVLDSAWWWAAGLVVAWGRWVLTEQSRRGLRCAAPEGGSPATVKVIVPLLDCLMLAGSQRHLTSPPLYRTTVGSERGDRGGTRWPAEPYRTPLEVSLRILVFEVVVSWRPTAALHEAPGAGRSPPWPIGATAPPGDRVLRATPRHGGDPAVAPPAPAVRAPPQEPG